MIDLTLLAKKGLIKLPENKKEEIKEIPISTGNTDFLSSMASSASSSGGMGNKIDDFEFKLESLSRRIDSILDRIDLVEKKLSRNERQG